MSVPVKWNRECVSAEQGIGPPNREYLSEEIDGPATSPPTARRSGPITLSYYVRLVLYCQEQTTKIRSERRRPRRPDGRWRMSPPRSSNATGWDAMKIII